MALTTLEDLIFFDAIGMINLDQAFSSSGGMESELNQMSPEAVRAFEIQVGNSVSNDLGVNVKTNEFDFWGMGFYGNDINVQTMGPTSPTTDILDTGYEDVSTTVSTGIPANTTPTTIPALPAATTPCLTCKDGDLMTTIQKHKKAVGLGVLVVLIIAAFTIGKSL